MKTLWKGPSLVGFLFLLLAVLSLQKGCDAKKCYLCHDNFESGGRIVYNYDNCGVGIPKSYSRPTIVKCHGGCYKLVTAVNPRENSFHTIKACASWFTECLKVSRNSTGGYYFGTVGNIQTCLNLGNGPGVTITDGSSYKRSKTGEIFIEQFVGGGQLYRYGSQTSYRLWECNRDSCNGASIMTSGMFLQLAITTSGLVMMVLFGII